MKTFATSGRSRPEPIEDMPPEEAVWVDPARMSGVPCFRVARLSVRQLFDWLEDGVPLDEFLQDFQIDPKAAAAILHAGAEAVYAGAAENPNCASHGRSGSISCMLLNYRNISCYGLNSPNLPPDERARSGVRRPFRARAKNDPGT